MSEHRRLSGVPLLVTSSVSLSLAIACHIVALSTRYWIETTSSRDGEPVLNLGLWEACFNNYEHKHELPARRYDGCHALYSHYYANVRDWLIPRQSLQPIHSTILYIVAVLSEHLYNIMQRVKCSFSSATVTVKCGKRSRPLSIINIATELTRSYGSMSLLLRSRG